MHKHVATMIMITVSTVTMAQEPVPSPLVLEVVTLSNRGEVKVQRHECKEGKDINLTGLFAHPLAGNVHVVCLDATKAEVKADLQLIGGFVPEPKFEQKAVLLSGSDQSIDLSTSGALLTVKPAVTPASAGYQQVEQSTK